MAEDRTEGQGPHGAQQGDDPGGTEPGGSAVLTAEDQAPDEPVYIVKRRRRFKAYPYLFMAPALILVFIVFAYPIVAGIWTSLHLDSVYVAEREFVGLETYTTLFDRPQFWNAMQNSVIFVVATVVFGVLLALGFATALYYVPRFNKTLRTISLIPWLISGIAVAWIFRFLFNRDVGAIGPVMEFFGMDPVVWIGHPTRAMVLIIIANTWYLVPFGTLLLLAGMHMLDQELFDAGKVDGASSWQLFTRVTLPQLKPHVGVVLVVMSFAAWNTFDLVIALTFGGPQGATEVLALYMYNRAFMQLIFSEGAAIMAIILAINVVLSVWYLYWMRAED